MGSKCTEHLSIWASMLLPPRRLLSVRVAPLLVAFLLLQTSHVLGGQITNDRIHASEAGLHAPVDRVYAVCGLLDIRRTDPTRAQWCLERLVPLYEQLIKEHSTVLEHRLSLADTLNELALLRIDTLDTALRRSELDPVEAVRQTQQATAEAKRAVDVLFGPRRVAGLDQLSDRSEAADAGFDTEATGGV